MRWSNFASSASLVLTGLVVLFLLSESRGTTQFIRAGADVSSSDVCVELVPSPGPQGEAGETGDTGPQGEAGPQGLRGEAGECVEQSATLTDLIPSLDNTYSLGSLEYRWKDLQLGPGTLYIEAQTTGNQAALTVSGGALLLDGADSLRIGNLRFTANGLESMLGDQDIQVGNVGDTGYLSVATGVKYPDGTIQETATLVGPQGEIGPQGLQGETGPQGAAGPAGASPVTSNPTLTIQTANGNMVYSGTPISATAVTTGQVVMLWVEADLTTVSSFGTGQLQLTLPFTCLVDLSVNTGHLHDASKTKHYMVEGECDQGSNLLKLYYHKGSNSELLPLTPTSLVTITSTDELSISGTFITP